MGHHDAWSECSQQSGFSLVVEADFVPVIGFGQQTVPIPEHMIGRAWGWLYSSGQRAYEFDGTYIRGHSATTVAYIIDDKAASKILGFMDHEFSQYNPREYRPWDTYVRMYAQNRDVFMYLPFRSYGEHGGMPNTEHKTNQINPSHQADVLINRLHFLPSYARNSKARYFFVRARAYAKAWARLLCFRYIELPTLQTPTTDWRYKVRFVVGAVSRLLLFIRSPQNSQQISSDS